ncbi:MAG: UDP-N-acetylmuramoylalanyl-D-glutamyl-2, 6-diaminopimelate--D-alanyl-D-alanine ligase, partial [Firmicutes bacterium]|nr:UDP-N-acetylmuramoylalanyl-D-glutamyl-2, 6-diaminopimelate--D-alanyl-D-alanine ligase [Bacillota bacterium]
MIPLDPVEAGAALGLPPLRTGVSGVSVDSRTLRPGDLFVALRGPRHDGHDFVPAAFAAGACGAVVERRWWAVWQGRKLPGITAQDWKVIYPVEDTLAALGQLGQAVRRKSGAQVIAITGSVGKTGTKDLVRALASSVRRVVATAANQNNEV